MLVLTPFLPQAVDEFARAPGGAIAAVAYLGVLLVFAGIAPVGVFIVAVIMVLFITGSAMNQRPTAQQWYDAQDRP